MHDIFYWRRKFIEVIEEVYRELGFDPPSMAFDSEASLVMEIDVDKVMFEVVHNPQHNLDNCLVEAHLGPISYQSPEEVLKALLEKNFEFAGKGGGCFSADVKDDVILFSMPVPLESIRGGDLLKIMRDVANSSLEWYQILSGMALQAPEDTPVISLGLA